MIWQGRSLVLMASNDYLGLARDPRLARAAGRAALGEGAGSGASPLVSGWLPTLRGLERDLAQFEQAGKCMVFPSGFAANLAAVTAMAGPGDLILSDEMNHASLIDGCRLSRATVHIYRHRDVQHAAELATRHRSSHRRLLLVTDSVFSMDGDQAPLAELEDLALRMEGILLVDEAHATGVLGPFGRGLALDACAKLAKMPGRLARVGTLSKALGAQGGFLLGDSGLIRLVVNRGRSYLFSTALAPAVAGAARMGLRVAEKEPWRRQKVQELARGLRAALREKGFDPGEGDAPIIPVILGEADRAVAWSRALSEAGYLVPAIRYPSVPEGKARLRITLSAHLDHKDVDSLVVVLADLARRGV